MTIEEFQDEKKKILSRIPEQFHNVLSQKAWDDGHAYGFREVLNYLDELVTLLDAPIRSFHLAVRTEMLDKVRTGRVM
jgi:hypothetical protein